MIPTFTDKSNISRQLSDIHTNMSVRFIAVKVEDLLTAETGVLQTPIILYRKGKIKMSLGENLQFLRKKNDITQEQLAEKLEVSRQSVSKWESDTTYPEMEKLVQLCQMFHLSMDDLIQKDISSVYVEDKAHYDNHMNLFSKMITLGIGLILFGISVMMFLNGMRIKEELCTVVFLIFLVIAVAILIVMGMRHSDFEQKNPYIENFYTEEEVDRFNKKFPVMIAAGVTIILIGVIFVTGLESVFKEYFENTAFGGDEIISSLFLLLITIAVSIIVYAGLQKEKYSIKEYNLAHDKESLEYRKGELTGKVCGCIMMIATIIYLLLSFTTNNWGMPNAAVFPVFGIGCGIASVIINLKFKK